jgi:hypothetical protein
MNVWATARKPLNTGKRFLNLIQRIKMPWKDCRNRYSLLLLFFLVCGCGSLSKLSLEQKNDLDRFRLELKSEPGALPYNCLETDIVIKGGPRSGSVTMGSYMSGDSLRASLRGPLGVLVGEILIIDSLVTIYMPLKSMVWQGKVLDTLAKQYFGVPFSLAEIKQVLRGRIEIYNLIFEDTLSMENTENSFKIRKSPGRNWEEIEVIRSQAKIRLLDSKSGRLCELIGMFRWENLVWVPEKIVYSLEKKGAVEFKYGKRKKRDINSLNPFKLIIPEGTIWMQQAGI